MTDEDTEKIIEQLKQLPQREPPPDLISGVMRNLQPSRKPVWQRFFGHLTASRQITLRPLPLLAGTVCIAIAFGLGVLTGMDRAKMSDASPDGNGKDIVAMALKDVEASFLIGRGLMAAGFSEEALPLLQNASMLAPDKPEYAYWEGLCFWANGMPEKERSSYMRGIDASPDTVPLRLNLGHSFLEQRELQAALAQYNKVLEVAPSEQVALYNRGLVFNLAQDSENARDAWKSYLQHYRVGRKSLQAVEHLNNLDDFTFRSYQLGHRKIILNQSALLSINSLDGVSEDVDLLAQVLGSDPELSIDIVCFYENDALVARKKAILLKKNILAVLGKDEESRVRLSWFGEQESVQTAGGLYSLSESFLLFGQYKRNPGEEAKI